MHHTNMPPLRVIGLTGPVGSGCTSLSYLFDQPGRPRAEPNHFLRILATVDKVVETRDGGVLAIRWSTVNDNIRQLYRSSTSGNNDAWQLGDNEPGREQRLRAELIEALEHREAVHALDNLFAYYTPHGHLFRTISVSDLIVFHTLMSIEKRGSDLGGLDDHYKPFCSMVSKDREIVLEVLHKRIAVHSFKEYYERLYKEQDEEDIRNLCKAFGWIHGLSNRIKDHFRQVSPEIYTAVLQDFGDNIRRSGDPFETSTRINPDCAAQLASAPLLVI